MKLLFALLFVTQSFAVSSGKYVVSGLVDGFDEKKVFLKNESRVSEVPRSAVSEKIQITVGKSLSVELNEKQFAEVKTRSLVQIQKKKPEPSQAPLGNR